MRGVHSPAHDLPQPLLIGLGVAFLLGLGAEALRRWSEGRLT
jgi:hypothetical protein